jgi:hypothetical protein
MCRVYEIIGINQVDKGRSFPTEIVNELPAGIAGFGYSLLTPKETLAYYINNVSPVYCVMLDATKAYDRVNYCKLFREAMKRRLPATRNRYANHTTRPRIAWNGVYSNSFKVFNGVKQGARPIIGPMLFCIYLDGLLSILRYCGVGCFVGDVFVGALAYADDLSLLSPTPCGIHQLPPVCESYACEIDIAVNGDKSKCILTALTKYRATIYGSNPQLTTSGKDIEYLDRWSYTLILKKFQ